jgi:hypothetical protein
LQEKEIKEEDDEKIVVVFFITKKNKNISKKRGEGRS